MIIIKTDTSIAEYDRVSIDIIEKELWGVYGVQNNKSHLLGTYTEEKCKEIFSSIARKMKRPIIETRWSFQGTSMQTFTPTTPFYEMPPQINENK